MRTNREKVDRNIDRLKKSMKKIPDDDQMILYWILLRDTLKDCKGVVWVYGELGRLVEREFGK